MAREQDGYGTQGTWHLSSVEGSPSRMNRQLYNSSCQPPRRMKQQFNPHVRYGANMSYASARKAADPQQMSTASVFKPREVEVFNGYKERNNLFPEKDQATFYDANKEVTMKGLKHGILPWRKMTKREAAQPIKTEQPEDSYDHMKAIEQKTFRMKPKASILSDFAKTRARDDALFRTSDAFANVLLENTKEERELQI